ncbi:hypothetical protein [Aurantiacibacter spongiae]|uniref:Uncharacterized protein n=1 Tax=Aurantiacibacter spongiae TaxID=2488860 RepID=A0A3N5CPS8_9SPHN|nr:hypothetical protein [Aurantiacibacter spongiae]RPF70587.1 hypothetical protein EG799_02320 [Aurantiacibacter spongiae]
MQKSYRTGGVGMLPAAPGTYLVHAYFDDNQVDLVKIVVVGWQVSPDRRLVPLVIDPRATDEEPWFVIHPCGRVESHDGRGWVDVDDWIDEEKRNRREAA